MLNLTRKKYLQRISEDEKIKKRILNYRILENILITIPVRCEAFRAALENTMDPSKITLKEVLHILEAREQRRLMRQERTVEGIYLTE